MTRPGIVICRAEPGASRTAALLDARGYRALIEPLLVSEALSSPLPDLDGGSHIALTSPNGAIRLAGMTPRRDLTIYGVGSATCDEARRAGFEALHCANGDAGDLAALILARAAKHTPILHLANQAADDTLVRTLRAGGIKARRHHVYKMAERLRPGPILSALIKSEGFEAPTALLIHSAAGGRALARLLAGAPPFGQRILALSAQAGAPAQGLSREPIIIAGAPNDTALLLALDALHETLRKA